MVVVAAFIGAQIGYFLSGVLFKPDAGTEDRALGEGRALPAIAAVVRW